jgi:hypothetical protein
LRFGKALGGLERRWVDFYEAIDLRQFQDTADHAGDAGEAQRTAGDFQTREAINDFSDATAIDFGDSGKIEDDAGLFFAEELIDGQLETLALDAHLERSSQFQCHDTGVEFFSNDVHANPPLVRCDFLAA